MKNKASGGSQTCAEGTHEELLRSNEKYSNFIRLREEAAGWKLKADSEADASGISKRTEELEDMTGCFVL